MSLTFLTARVRLLVCLSLIFITAPLFAANDFIVKDIVILGNERISKGTVLNYLPVRSGEKLSVSRYSELLRALYDTGLFKDIKFSRKGNVLRVHVVERPAIAEIEFDGNYLLPDDKLKAAMSDMGLATAQVFNPSLLDGLEQELRRLYSSQGFYALKVSSEVTELERNRVGIEVNISEGETARIRKINILGNNDFSEEKLLDLMDSGVPGAFAFWSSADEYSRTKLSADLERLQSFYQDLGYIRFEILSTQVSISDDKSEIYVSINIKEGKPYTISKVSLSGKIPFPDGELQPLLKVLSGDVFSRKNMGVDRSALQLRLDEAGYAFANINVVPEINDKRKSVALTFFIDPGKRVYVRRITFSGHSKTQDTVFRRELRQFEGGWYAPSKLDRSRIRLQRLRFVESVNVKTNRVAASDDQLDIEFEIKERASGAFTIGAGYSSSQGVIFNLGLTNDNVFGTGNRLSVNFDNTKATKQTSFSYTDPYFTEDGISRTYSVFARKTDSGEISNTSKYLLDAYGGGLSFGIPLSEYTTARLGGNVEVNDIKLTTSTPTHIQQFVTDNGDQYNIANLTGSLNYDSRNRTVFAESGHKHQLNLEYAIPASDIAYYKVGYDYEFYYPVHDFLTASVRLGFDYGDGYDDQTELPFFEKYYIGGVRSLRGYSSSSLGPKDSAGNAMGGDFKTLATLEFIFPPPWVEKPGSVRFSVFYDIGYVFPDVSSYDSDELRESMGVSFNWLSPIGPLVFSWADAIDPREGDRTDTFQFSIGTLF